MLKNTGIYLLSIMGLVAGCSKPYTANRPVYSEYKPILMQHDRITTDLFFLAPRDKANITKIKDMGKYLLALEYGLGLHICDMSDKNNPREIGFYQVPACIDLEVKDMKAYVNNYNDFLIIDFSNVGHPKVVKREKNAFDIRIKTPDGLNVHDGLKNIPPGTVVISYEKL